VKIGEESEIWKFNFCCKDTTRVVLRHACCSRDTGRLGWKCFVIQN